MAEQRDDNYSGVWDGRLGFGKKSALVSIDLLKGYTTEGSPLYAPGVVDACNEMPELLDAARKAGIDIFHTQVRYNEHNFIDGGIWIKKAPVLKCLVESDPLAHFDERVLPAEGETIITKQYASVFFGTSFASHADGCRHRHTDHHRLHHLRLHPRHGRGLRAERLPPDLRARMHRRSSRRSA